MASSSDFLKTYELAAPTIRKLYDSKLRLAIMSALEDGPMRLADLRRIVKANAPNTSSKAKDLEELGAVERVEGDFKLTPFGVSVLKRVQETIEFYGTYEKFKNLWMNYDISGIPTELVNKFGDLMDSTIVKDTDDELEATHKNYVQMLNSITKKFYGASSTYHKDYAKLAISLADKGADIQLVLTEAVIQKTMRELSRPQARAITKLPNLKIYIIKSLNLTFTVSENFFVLGLSNKHINIGYNEVDLASRNPQAIEWGFELFDYYKGNSKLIKLSDYL